MSDTGGQFPEGGEAAGQPGIARWRVVDSTQDIAFRLAETGAADGSAVVAESQRAGRGRRGRTWCDEPGASLLCSILVRPRLLPAQWPLLSLVAGVAVARAIERAAGLASRLKWPNDVLVDGRKVAGILLESRLAPVPAVVVGVGINVGQEGFSPGLAATATSIRLHTGCPVDREALLATLLEEFGVWRRRLEDEGFAPIRSAWKASSATLGTRVRVGDLTGCAVDLDATGALVLDAGSRRYRVVAGDVVTAGSETAEERARAARH